MLRRRQLQRCRITPERYLTRAAHPPPRADDEHYAMVAAVAMNRDGTRTSASADELKLLASLTKQKGRVAAGRFGGRDAKMARIRQQEAAMADAAAAKLGMSSAPSAVATTGTTATGGAGGAGASDRSETTSEAKVSSKRRKKDKKAKSGGDEGEGGTEASSGGKKRKAKRGAAGGADQQPQQQREGGDGQLEGEQPKKQRIVIEPKIAHVGPVFQFVPTPATGALHGPYARAGNGSGLPACLAALPRCLGGHALRRLLTLRCFPGRRRLVGRQGVCQRGLHGGAGPGGGRGGAPPRHV